MESNWKKQRCHIDSGCCASVSCGIPASIGAYPEGMLVDAPASVGASPEGMLVERVDNDAAGILLNKKDLASAPTQCGGAACANLITEYEEIQRQSYAAGSLRTL